MTPIDLISRKDALKAQAAAYHEHGFNCAQCVVCAFASEVGADADAAFRLAEGLGLGMGGMTETCGALSGAVMVLGQLVSRGAADPTTKVATYRLAREAARRFGDMSGATVCKTLKGVESPNGALRACPECIDAAVDILTDIIDRHRAAEAGDLSPQR